MKQKIDIKECRLLSTHTMDPLGRVYEYQGRILRLIKKEKYTYVLNLFQNGIINGMVERGLFVKSWIVDGIDDGNLWIEHEKILSGFGLWEWTYGMLEDYKNLIVDTNLFLLPYGYEIGDSHPANVGFKGCKLMFLDLGSIRLQSECKDRAYLYTCMNTKTLIRLLNKSCLEEKEARCLINHFRTEISEGCGEHFKRIKGCFKQINDKIVIKLFYEENAHRTYRDAIFNCLRKLLNIDEDRIINRKMRKYSALRKLSYLKNIKFEDGVWTNYSEAGFDRGGGGAIFY